VVTDRDWFGPGLSWPPALAHAKNEPLIPLMRECGGLFAQGWTHTRRTILTKRYIYDSEPIVTTKYSEK